MPRQRSSKQNESNALTESAKERCGLLISDSCIQTIAWMLLTLGSCVIGIVLYLAVRQSDNGTDEDTKLYLTDERIVDRIGGNVNVEFLQIETVTDGDETFEVTEVNAKTDRQCPHACCGVECLGVDMPDHDLKLVLLINRTVRASIEDFNETSAGTINIIWFSDDTEEEAQSGGQSSELPEHNCTTYKPPFLEIDDLKLNTTYTFCMLDKKKETISPLNCQALHVPFKRPNMADDSQNGDDDDDDDEESDSTAKQDADGTVEEQEFTIGILCLIFSISAFVGAVIAYLGISSYPDLLEGSKNVFIVKNSNKTGYITTITDSEYTNSKYASMRKRRCSESFRQAKPQTQLAKVHSNPYTPDFKSLPSRSATFSNLAYEDDGYEIPKHVDMTCSSSQQSTPNGYGMSPNSPPPMPKRRSSSQDTQMANVFGQLNEGF